jgi:hypothetical protein
LRRTIYAQNTAQFVRWSSTANSSSRFILAHVKNGSKDAKSTDAIPSRTVAAMLHFARAGWRPAHYLTRHERASAARSQP